MSVFKQAILKGALLPIHIANGIYLKEYDDHILQLKCDDEVIAQFSSTGVTVQTIKDEATKYLERKGMI